MNQNTKRNLVSIFRRLNHGNLIESIGEINAINAETVILHQQTFTQFKNYCSGRPVTICGAGPTLQDYKPIEGAVHIACNRAFLYKPVKFDFIFAQDFDGIKMVENDLIDYQKDSCIKLFGLYNANPAKQIPESLARECHALRFNTDVHIYKDGFKSKFISDIDYRPIGCMPNVGLSVLQFALYMNPSELYIVGCDISGGHFSRGNQGVEQQRKQDALVAREYKADHEKLIRKWTEFKEFAHEFYPNTKIVSINPVGLTGMFEDLYQK